MFNRRDCFTLVANAFHANKSLSCGVSWSGSNSIKKPSGLIMSSQSTTTTDESRLIVLASSILKTGDKLATKISSVSTCTPKR